MSQQVTLQGRTLRMLRAGAPVTIGERLGEGGQGVVHAVTIGGAAYAVKWYRCEPPGELRKSIAALVERGRPHRGFIWPIDLVVSDESSGFGYVMPRLEPRFTSFAQLVSRSDQPPFRVVSTIGRHLVTAFEALHSAGLCHRDISFGNLWTPMHLMLPSSTTTTSALTAAMSSSGELCASWRRRWCEGRRRRPA
jgi:eukaryotic-like serine/threonine-protein kinase